MRRKTDARPAMDLTMDVTTGSEAQPDTLTLLRALVLAEEHLAVAQQRLAAAREHVAHAEAQEIALRLASSSEHRQMQGTQGLPRLLVSGHAAADALSISRTQLYRLMMSGALRTIKIGRRRLVAVSALEAFIADRLTEAL